MLGLLDIKCRQAKQFQSNKWIRLTIYFLATNPQIECHNLGSLGNLKVTRSKNNIKFYIPKLFLFRIKKQSKFSAVAIHRHCWQPRNSPCCSCKKSKKKQELATLYSRKQISFSALPVLMEKLISAIFSLKQRTQQEATQLFAWLCFYPVAHCLLLAFSISIKQKPGINFT